MFYHPVRYVLYASAICLICLSVAMMAKVNPRVSGLMIPFIFVGSYAWIAWYTEKQKNLPKIDLNSVSYDSVPNLSLPESKCSSCGSSSSAKGGATCSAKGGSCGVNGAKLQPILDPAFNLRETAKHILLLEDHLFHTGKRCPECCVKHILTIDGFLEEAVTLDKDSKLHDLIVKVLNDFRAVAKQLEADIQHGKLTMDDLCRNYAQRLRSVRKPITSAISQNRI